MASALLVSKEISKISDLAVNATQLAERSLLKQEVHDSNPVIGQFILKN